MVEGITIKQKQARITNFTKGRIKAALSAISYAAESEDVNITKECEDFLNGASLPILNALEVWDKKN